jgi:hypothetical protein
MHVLKQYVTKKGPCLDVPPPLPEKKIFSCFFALLLLFTHYYVLSDLLGICMGPD